MASALKIRQLRRIIVAYAVNRLGTWVGIVALMVAVFDHTHSAVAVAVVLVAAQALPAFAVPPLIARVEASRRRGELSGLYFFEALATTALAVLFWHFWLPAVVLLVALDGTAARAANALLRTEVARTAREHVLSEGAPDPGEAESPERLQEAHDRAEREANAALNVAFSLSFVLGPVLAGILVAAAGAPAALLIDAGSFVICGALLFDLRPRVAEAAGNTVRRRLSAAWRAIQEIPTLRGLLVAEAIAFVFFEAGAPIEISYAKSTLRAGDRGFGLLLSAWGVGTVLGSVVFARSIKRPLGYLLSAGTLAVGFAYIGFSAAPSLAVAAIAALVGGIGNGMELPSLFSIVQRLAPKQLHGQMMGAVESLSALCPAIGLPLGGLLVELGSPRSAFLLVGAGTAAAALALFRLSRPSRTAAEAGQRPAPAASAGDTAQEPAQ
ncbi:MAG: transporter [Solirubrobacterales bacterium]|nr:transporter [Solirubrobacterales bacterium]